MYMFFSMTMNYYLVTMTSGVWRLLVLFCLIVDFRAFGAYLLVEIQNGVQTDTEPTKSPQ